MTRPHFDSAEVTLWHGDCIEVMRTMPDATIDAVVTDPPYGLEFLGKQWDQFRDGSFQHWCEEWARECLRLLKPGGHLLAFGGSRMWHRLAAGIEDAGFDIRDSIAWIFASGMPKTANSLKPAFEPIVVARKPVEGTQAANIAAYGVGGMNVDGARVVSAAGDEIGRWPPNVVFDDGAAAVLNSENKAHRAGGVAEHRGIRRSPVDSEDGVQYGGGWGAMDFRYAYDLEDRRASKHFPVFHMEEKAKWSGRPSHQATDGRTIRHPTTKPIDLMLWLVRLVTPRGGTLLEPFAGSGTTVEACVREGFRCVAIEREDDYLPLIMQRLDKPHAVGFDLDWESA